MELERKDLPAEEIASLDVVDENEEHPSHCPAQVANDEGIIGEDIPEEAFDQEKEGRS